MPDLKNPKLIYLKAVLFLVILLLSSAVIILETRSWRIALLLALAIWSAARLYYFIFYVIEKYVDPTHKFAGLWAFLKYLLKKPKP